MVKTTDDEPETLTTAGIKYSRRSDVGRFDEEGNYECVRCGWTHTLQECLEYRVAMGNKELEKVARFVHVTPMHGNEGESPVDTLIRGYKTVAHNLKIMKPTDEAEVTDMMKEE